MLFPLQCVKSARADHFVVDVPGVVIPGLLIKKMGKAGEEKEVQDVVARLIEEASLPKPLIKALAEAA